MATGNIRNTRRNFARPSETFTASATTTAVSIVNGAMTAAVTINTVSNPIGPSGNKTYTITSTPTGITGTFTNTATSFTQTYQIPAGVTSGTYSVNIAENNYNGAGKPKVLSNVLTNVPQTFAASLLVVAGGAGGGAAGNSSTAYAYGGGGGAGGYREFTDFALVTGTNYTVTCGAGGSGGNSGAFPTAGSDSVFSNITSNGGGRAGQFQEPNYISQVGLTGGSGGGASTSDQTGGTRNGGSATSISRLPFVELYSVQGFSGGSNAYSSGTVQSAGGGGGASASGANGSGSAGGNGGAGRTSLVDGSTYAGGGGGAGQGTAGSGGSGGGAAGRTGNANGFAGTANTGGGGGGAPLTNNNGSYSGGNGGSGIVVFRYPNTRTITIGAGLTGTTAASGSFTIATITAGTGNVSWS